MKYELNFRNNHGTDQELLDDMKNVSETLGTKKLTSKAYSEHGIFSGDAIASRFKGWNNALTKAGLEITVTANFTEKDLFENLERVWIGLGRQPSKRDLKRPLSQFSETAYRTKFRTWRKALEQFVEFINSTTDEKEEIAIEEANIGTTEQKIKYKHTTKRIPSERLKVQVLMRDGNKCRLCGVTVSGDNIHFDHIKPWSKDGETVLENLQVLCETHNLAKGNLEYADVH